MGEDVVHGSLAAHSNGEGDTMTTEREAALVHAARNVVWKLSHNFCLPDYEGPARITRQDATVRMLDEALEVYERGQS